MINKDEREDRYEASEEGEYHFSDDEVNYEVESEASSIEKETKPSFLDRLKTMSRSRRMLLSIVVFLALVFIVYRMVAPTAVTQSTEITPTATVPITQVPPSTQVAPPAQIAISTVPEGAVQRPAPGQQPMAASAPTASTQAVVTQATVPSTLPQPSPQVTIPTAQPTVPATQPAAVPPVQPTTTVVQPTTQAITQAQLPQSTPTTTTMPGQAPAPTAPVAPPTSTVAPVTEQPTLPTTAPQALPSPGTALETTSDMASERLEKEYAEKFDAFAAQNKELQNQMQALSTRVANMETQMNQLIRVITRQADEARVDTAPPPAQVAPQRIPYTVQAIIPGRAWLRSDSGETITVTEGDTIKNLGRVTKIDPYDGIVEINTGTKVLTLTYGNGG